MILIGVLQAVEGAFGSELTACVSWQSVAFSQSADFTHDISLQLQVQLPMLAVSTSPLAHGNLQ